MEEVLLGIRLAEGLPLVGLPAAAVDRAAADGLLDPGGVEAGLAVLTLRGRLLADLVARDLTA
jgi:hypothetical protein